jgi:hypothetical protein
MDRKEERRNRFDRKKKFKKVTRASKTKAQKKTIKVKNNDSIVYGYGVDY